jgi:hypothetical protein
MLLNKYKKIKTEKVSSNINFFWKPPFPSVARIQVAPNPQQTLLGGLSIVFGEQPLPQKFWWLKKKKKSIKFLRRHFFFSSVVFNSIFLFKKFPKIKNKQFGKIKLKKNLLLVNKLFCAKRRYKGYAVKFKKGGYSTSTLGFRSFMPKSHSARLLTNKAPIEWLIGLSFNQRRKRFSACKKFAKLNLISSSKQQQKGIRLKKGERMRGRGPYWRNLAAIVNKRLDQEEFIVKKRKKS